MTAIEVRGPADALLDAPADLGARGLGGVTEGVVWRARCKDDDGRVWRAVADAPAGLADGWSPAKRGGPEVAGLSSLRPVALDVRVEAPDGRAGARTFVRRVVADDVVVRRWREKGLQATLLRPATAPAATVLLDAGPDAPAHVALAAALLASRGVLVLTVLDGLESAAERLEAVPGAAGTTVLSADEVPLPPGIPAVAAPRTDAWDALLARLGATPRS